MYSKCLEWTWDALRKLAASRTLISRQILRQVSRRKRLFEVPLYPSEKRSMLLKNYCSGSTGVIRWKNSNGGHRHDGTPERAGAAFLLISA